MRPVVVREDALRVRRALQRRRVELLQVLVVDVLVLGLAPLQREQQPGRVVRPRELARVEVRGHVGGLVGLVREVGGPEVRVPQVVLQQRLVVLKPNVLSLRCC